VTHPQGVVLGGLGRAALIDCVERWHALDGPAALAAGGGAGYGAALLGGEATAGLTPVRPGSAVPRGLQVNLSQATNGIHVSHDTNRKQRLIFPYGSVDVIFGSYGAQIKPVELARMLRAFGVRGPPGGAPRSSLAASSHQHGQRSGHAPGPAEVDDSLDCDVESFFARFAATSGGAGGTLRLPQVRRPLRPVWQAF
jgi:hypothetical protein